jgi:type III secretion regulatory protein HpaA
LFTKPNHAQNNPPGSRKFASLQRNKRRANERARRNAARGAGGGDEDGGGEVKNNDMDALNGGRGGGGGGRGREQEQQDDTQIEAMGGKAGADAQASGGARPASAQAAPTSHLDAIAAKFETGHEMQRAEAVRNAWHESIRQLFETAGNSEAGPWNARLSALIVNLLQIEMKIGSVGAGGISALKDLAQHAGKGMGSESFHHILPLAMLRASYQAGKARRERGGAIQQSVGAGIVARSRKKASGGDGEK